MVLGPEEILFELKARGCKLATEAWVDNHYGLILWKLAGMVGLDPQKEADETKRRWCWNELLRQFLYRYERELNTGVRPPIRLIASQDKPAGLPMVLCISRICSPHEYDAEEGTNVEPGPFTTDENGELVAPKPVVEVTDGWYRVRAEVDSGMIRAIQRGVLRVGMKVGLVGARLLDPRSEPLEILEKPWKNLRSDSIFALRISSNGCHLAPWHAKLGFQAQPFIATLASLTPDGGLVPVLDVKIVKTFPIAFMEGFTTDTGKTWSHPMKEPEEMKARDAWSAKRDIEAQRIRSDMDKCFDTLENCADRLEEACANSTPHESPKDIIARTSKEEAGWLARAVREQLAKGRENMGDEIAQRLEILFRPVNLSRHALQEVCPPRDVRNFRVVVVEDAQTRKRPKQFTAQVTIWDVLTAYISEEGIPGDFKVGERFIVTNLDPNNTDAWMPRQDGAVLYLLGRRDTRWRKTR
ncbi:hypothetical protein PHLGIDRAFT_100069 [Phlebiopsis gigantea 11061_1 CR5-6]|uniref:BRCA2 OB1 domain-containing protein n=1 Tax=Phlebiopsis gigantea (strain 11061_1 CR5-6) TaxID=745531 RepID=A0A0C3S589_PHLG1|nr:hypothetical protein PHLGIDRAFT_100069 [Phlebiopsis gigantea 11061_1 CR5-6]